jgi:CRP-like cAMP-binding protein
MLLRGSSRALSGRQPEQRAPRTRRRTAIALGGVPLFAGFSKRDLGRLAVETDELSFAPGEVVVEEGTLGETLFVVLSGQAKVVRGGRTVARILPGDFFGELSAIDGGPRSATVAAETPLVVLRLFRHTLARVLRAEPQLALKILDTMVRRIREVERSIMA